MGQIFALILTLQAHGALIERAGPYPTFEACRAAVATVKAVGVACLSESDLNSATLGLFGRRPSEIWK